MKRQGNLLKTYKLNLFFIIFASFLELFFLIEINLTFALILFILSFGTVLGGIYATNLFSAPLLNEMIDRAAEMHLIKNPQKAMDKDQAVTKLSGAYYGLMMFATSILSALSSAIYGVIFQGENSQNPIVLTLGLASMGLFHIISLVFLKSFKVKLKES